MAHLWCMALREGRGHGAGRSGWALMSVGATHADVRSWGSCKGATYRFGAVGGQMNGGSDGAGGSDGIVKRLPGDGRQGGIARRPMRGGVCRTDAGFYRVRSWGEWRIRSVSLPFDGACRGRAWRWDCRVAPVWCDWRKRGRMSRASARGHVHAKASPMAGDMPRNVQFRRVAGSLHGESKELARFVLVTARIVSCGGFQSPFLSIDGE